MREILFRGKRRDNGEWTYGSFIPDLLEVFEGVKDLDGFIKPFGRTQEERIMVEVDRETVGQYTGLADKNGVKIFEGDIVLVNGSTESPYLFEVKFGTCGGVKNVEHKVGYVGFYFSVITDSKWIKSSLRTDPIYFLSDLGCEAKVIGNIHDKPELLK